MIPNITVRAREIRKRSTPTTRIRHRPRLDIRRQRIPSKTPDANARLPQLDSHHPAPSLIESGPVRLGRGRGDTAPGIAVRPVVTVPLARGAGHLAADVAHIAVIARVQRHRIPAVALVGRLEDVNLAVRRPDIGIWVGQPESRPGAAAIGGVAHIKEEEGADGVLRL